MTSHKFLGRSGQDYACTGCSWTHPAPLNKAEKAHDQHRIDVAFEDGEHLVIRDVVAAIRHLEPPATGLDVGELIGWALATAREAGFEAGRRAERGSRALSRAEVAGEGDPCCHWAAALADAAVAAQQHADDPALDESVREVFRHATTWLSDRSRLYGAPAVPDWQAIIEFHNGQIKVLADFLTQIPQWTDASGARFGLPGAGGVSACPSDVPHESHFWVEAIVGGGLGPVPTRGRLCGGVVRERTKGNGRGQWGDAHALTPPSGGGVAERASDVSTPPAGGES